jgi:soluble lytic murein transglycosylase
MLPCAKGGGPPVAVIRLPLILAGTCLGSGLALLGGRYLLRQLPQPEPLLASPKLELLLHLAPDPSLRRQAALLLLGRAGEDPRRQRALLAGQGWGFDPLAAVVLKRDALAAARLGQVDSAERLWQQLLQRFANEPAAADGLYALGGQRPALRQQLLRRFAAHPAALAAAVEAGDAAHLARWGVRWPGARSLLRRNCERRGPIPTAAERDQLATGLAQLGDAERDQLATGLAQLGDAEAAQRCLRGRAASAPGQLAIAQALVKGDASETQRGEILLLQLAQRQPTTPLGREAARLLCEGRGPVNLQLVRQLPASLRAGGAVQARLALEPGLAGQKAAALGVLRRWPAEPAAWQLQWELARAALLAQRWRDAETLLAPELSRALPGALAARQLFWLGLSQEQLGRQQAAHRSWQAVLSQHPWGYYGWRAALRLDQGRLALTAAADRPLPRPQWRPLNSGQLSGQLAVDRLWRLDQPLEAWEHWRLQSGGQAPETPRHLIVEGRLRRGVGDHWIGLGQLEQAELRLPLGDCQLTAALQASLAAVPMAASLERAGRGAGLAPSLLAAVARQESRFSAAVHSPAGAVGLLQLMPETAAELAGRPLANHELEDPERNASLGASYLSQLLRQWRGNPLLAVASYNAGPGAVAGWRQPNPQRWPELWVEAIPYPETRLYVKKVLGNLWSLQLARQPHC